VDNNPAGAGRAGAAGSASLEPSLAGFARERQGRTVTKKLLSFLAVPLGCGGTRDKGVNNDKVTPKPVR